MTVAGGTPTLTLNDGGIATYSGGSGSNALTFSYTVAAGQNTSALAATAVNLNSATITDGAGNAANLSLSGLTQSGPQIDTLTPSITSLIESPASGDLNAGKTVTLTLNLNEAVTVTGGTPTLTLNDVTDSATGDPGHLWRVVVRPLPGGRFAVIAMSLDDMQSTVGQLEIAEVVAGAAAVALLVGISFPLIRASLSPLTKIEGTAEAIAAGDLSQRITHPAEKTEVGRLASALNAMLGRIESAYRAREEGEASARDSEDRMRRFVADASHELRTPLTSVRGLAEFYLLQGETASRAEVTRLMSGIQAEAARMGRLVDDLLLLARFDEDRALDTHPVDLASVAAEAVRSARAVRPGTPLTLLAAPEPVIVNADAARLRQIIDNLIGNAAQHTPAGTPVSVTVGARPATARSPSRTPGPACPPSRRPGSSSGSTAPTAPAAGPTAAPGSGCPSWPRSSPRTGARSPLTPSRDAARRSPSGFP